MTSLALLQLVSPALPVGAFSYSEGLEVLIQAGSIADEQAIQEWLSLTTSSHLFCHAVSAAMMEMDCISGSTVMKMSRASCPRRPR